MTTYALYDREAEHYEEIGKVQAQRIIERAELHTGPYGAIGSDIDRVLYDNETVSAIRYRGQWFDIPEVQAPFVSAELSLHSYDPLPD